MPPTVSLTSPGYGATFTSPAKISLAATVNPNGHTIAKVQFYADGTLVGEATSAPYAADWAATGVGACNLTARVLYESNGSVDSQPVKVTLTTLPAPWETADLGGGIAAGDAVFTNDTFVVTGAGNIGSTADNFRYVYQTLSGDGDITVELKSAALSSPAGRVGVMIRESLANGAKAAFVGLDSNGACHTIWRTATGGDSNDSVPSMKATSDLWVRLVRSGNRLTAYYSTNGRRWSSAGNQTISMASNIYIGLAVASGNTDTPVVANFGTPVVTP
jgi:regulation of enolase protein 1 (concanavalin A-like superfamily)